MARIAVDIPDELNKRLKAECGKRKVGPYVASLIEAATRSLDKAANRLIHIKTSEAEIDKMSAMAELMNIFDAASIYRKAQAMGRNIPLGVPLKRDSDE